MIKTQREEHVYTCKMYMYMYVYIKRVHLYTYTYMYMYVYCTIHVQCISTMSTMSCHVHVLIQSCTFAYTLYMYM